MSEMQYAACDSKSTHLSLLCVSKHLFGWRWGVHQPLNLKSIWAEKFVLQKMDVWIDRFHGWELVWVKGHENPWVSSLYMFRRPYIFGKGGFPERALFLVGFHFGGRSGVMLTEN